jgi:anti-anti-sigma factor
MPREPNAAKKPYSPPSLVVLDASAAKAKLKAREGLKDPIVQKMLSLRLRTETCISGEVIVLRCLGRLVIGEEITAFRDEIKKLLSERHRIVLDLSDIEHIDSVGLAGLVGLFTWASSEKREIRLVYTGGPVTDLLRRTRLDKVLKVCTSEQEAIASFSGTEAPSADPQG